MGFVGSSILATGTPPRVGATVSTFGQVSALASGSETVVASYTVPIGKTFFLQHCEVSGENIAKYSVFVDGIRQSVKRTYWGGSFNEEFLFKDDLGRGVEVAATKVVEIKTIHFSPVVGDFDGRILGVET